MKKVFVLMAALLIQAQAHAQTSVVLSERDVELNADISSENVKVSIAGYSLPTTKILVPELADVTILDHRNEGEGAPCLATSAGTYPEDVIQNNPAKEKIKLHITLTRSATVDADNICRVSLAEAIEGKVRGFTFQHGRSIMVGTRHLDDCR